MRMERHVQDDGGEAEDNFVQPSNTVGFPYQQPDYDYGSSASSSSRGSGMIMLGMTHHPGATTHHGVDLHLGQKLKLGGRYTDISLIYISYSVRTLYIHVSLSFCSC